MNVIEAYELTKTYGHGAGAVSALKGVSFALDAGDFVAIMGASGCGKSTLLYCLAGLDIPDSGDVFVDGTRVDFTDMKQVLHLRRHTFGFIFQNYQLIPTLTAEENILLPLRISHTAVDNDHYAELTERLGIGSFLGRKPSELSGGQQQRVACARALIHKPTVIFADEPTGALDSQSSHDVLEVFKDTVTALGMSVLMVTHDRDAAGYATRLVSMCDGQIAE